MPVGDEPADVVEDAGLMRFQPFEQRTGHVQREREEPGVSDVIQEWPVNIAHVLRKHVIEIADRLVNVDAENKTQRFG